VVSLDEFIESYFEQQKEVKERILELDKEIVKEQQSRD